MITEKHTQELFSRAYAIMMAGRAGMNLALRELDYGVDGTFRPVKVVNNKRIESGFPIDFQLKATINCEVRQDHVAYDCEADTYNSLADRAQDAGVPCLLLVLCLPRDRATWLVVDEECVILRRCCYWFSISGQQTPNTGYKRLQIPRTQLFTVDALKRIAEKVRAGEPF